MAGKRRKSGKSKKKTIVLTFEVDFCVKWYEKGSRVHLMHKSKSACFI